MVRLIVPGGMGLQKQILYFNSTMVRLIVLSFVPNNLHLSFQFHDGTIDRAVENTVFAHIVHFNSTMVRLIVNFWNSLSSTCSNFNSTMVRLIAKQIMAFPLLPVFQFHDGTIDSHATVLHAIKTIRFQFHDGTIDSQVANNLVVWFVISIPRWYD